MAVDASEPRFLYIISTGRCGTQWLASVLGAIYADRAVIEHEPLGPAYRPKETLRVPGRLAELASTPPLARHLARIDGILEHSPYIECGWPAFAAVPIFIDRFGPRLRLIHLVRHPVYTALSYQTVNHYQLEPGDQWLPCELDPFDAGVMHPHYRDRWDRLSAYEKSLFQWLEIHTWAETLKRDYPQAGIRTVRLEDLFSPHGAAVLHEITDMAGLPRRQALDTKLYERVDAHQQGTFRQFEWTQIYEYPEVMALATHYGYEFDTLESERLIQRYRSPVLERLNKQFKHFKRRWRRRLQGTSQP